MLSRPRSGKGGGRVSGTAMGLADSASGSVGAFCGFTGVGAPEAAVPTSVGATVSHSFIVGVRVVALIVLRRCLLMNRCGFMLQVTVCRGSLWAMLCMRVASNRHTGSIRA